jgi:NAD(P)H-dependent FMN reductase
MKILVLNGSPRKKGTVATLLAAVAEGARDQGHDVEWVDVYDLCFQPCVACMRCRPDGTCRLAEDDAHAVGGRIGRADGLIVGTPTHWGNMSSQLKALFDRTVPVFMGERANGLPQPRQKGKAAIVVTACTTPWPFNVIFAQSRGAIRAVREVLGYGGYRIITRVVKPGTKKHPGMTPKVLNRARRAGQRLR